MLTERGTQSVSFFKMCNLYLPTVGPFLQHYLTSFNPLYSSFCWKLFDMFFRSKQKAQFFKESSRFLLPQLKTLGLPARLDKLTKDHTPAFLCMHIWRF